MPLTQVELYEPLVDVRVLARGSCCGSQWLCLRMSEDCLSQSGCAEERLSARVWIYEGFRSLLWLELSC